MAEGISLARLWRDRNRFLPILMLVALMLVPVSVAQDPAPESGHLDLLDRASDGADSFRGMSATLAVGLATPGITFMGIGAGTSLMGVGPPAYQGNFYVAPTDFPTSWYPFAVTGAFAYGLMLPAPTVVPTAMVAAGVAPGPFTPPGMWAAFGTAMVPLPMFMTDMVFAGPLATTLPVTAPLGVACGIYVDPVVGPHLGGVTMPVPTMVGPLFTFNGPPTTTMDTLAFAFSAFIEWAAGCFVTGATVPVELQSFHID